jgi:hypothetical protein
VLVVKLILEIAIFTWVTTFLFSDGLTAFNSVDEIVEKASKIKDFDGFSVENIRLIKPVFYVSVMMMAGLFLKICVELYQLIRHGYMGQVDNQQRSSNSRDSNDENKINSAIRKLTGGRPEVRDTKVTLEEMARMASSEERNLAVQWVKVRKGEWLDQIQVSNYKNYGIDNHNIFEFCQDVADLIELLQRNVQRGLAATPRRSKPPVLRRIPDSLPHHAAIGNISTLVKQELENEVGPLRKEVKEMILLYMELLVDNIDQ